MQHIFTKHIYSQSFSFKAVNPKTLSLAYFTTVGKRSHFKNALFALLIYKH